MRSVMSRPELPLRERSFDLVFIVFYAINLLFITYIVDLEQLVIPNASNFVYPPWPPRFLVDLVHWYGGTFDPLLIARPVWWKMTIWIDAVLFGPYYAVAIYAFIRGRNWIRIPCIVTSAMLVTNVVIILGEEVAGPFASPSLLFVVGVNLPWVVVPILAIARMSRLRPPFARH